MPVSNSGGNQLEMKLALNFKLKAEGNQLEMKLALKKSIPDIQIKHNLPIIQHQQQL
jgi:hypothetical protein